VVICLFGTRYAADRDADVENWLDTVLLKALSQLDGFISFHLYEAADGEVLGVIRFDSREALEA
jgi:heme-degrading monooxygenase HmoA